MRYLLLTLLLIFPALVSAQELHTFSNGEVADAEKINENFEALKSEISGSGGCSAEQDGSSVVITCADGTSGVLASEGTVVVYPEGGITGESPVQSWPTGEIVWVDATDLVLGKVTTTPSEILVDGYKAGVKNDHDENISYITSHGGSTDIKLFFLTEDCSGQGFVYYGQRNRLVFADGIYVADTTIVKEQLLTKSYIRAEGFWVIDGFNRDISCKAKEYTYEVLPLIEYQLAPELQELAYPVSRVQLP